MSTKSKIVAMIRKIIHDNLNVSNAYTAMRNHGISETDAEHEILRAWLGCSWEVGNGLPDRRAAVFNALKDGSSTGSLFPDGLHSDAALTFP